MRAWHRESGIAGTIEHMLTIHQKIFIKIIDFSMTAYLYLDLYKRFADRPRCRMLWTSRVYGPETGAAGSE
ncbi:MAG: hypothetical protein NW241_09955 [Bacteroidia bacterium]|nr:hypothetical protein [Bacteroidia bacterium]